LKEEGKTQREIAEEIGISEAAISKNLTSDKCQKLSSSSPTPTTPEPDDDKALPISEVLGSNIIPSPVSFQKQEPVNDYPMLSFDKFLRGSSPHLSNLDR